MSHSSFVIPRLKTAAAYFDLPDLAITASSSRLSMCFDLTVGVNGGHGSAVLRKECLEKPLFQGY